MEMMIAHYQLLEANSSPLEQVDLDALRQRARQWEDLDNMLDLYEFLEAGPEVVTIEKNGSPLELKVGSGTTGILAKELIKEMQNNLERRLRRIQLNHQ